VAQNAPRTVFLAEDEAGLYLQATTTSVWYPIGQTPVIRVAPGREKTCFYGTLNLLTGQEVAMRTPVMNAEVTAQHLNKLLQTYPDDLILLFWDRARWHRGPSVEQILRDNPRLEVVFFPVASPEMNLNCKFGKSLGKPSVTTIVNLVCLRWLNDSSIT
jgi:hypothetical protein